MLFIPLMRCRRLLLLLLVGSFLGVRCGFLGEEESSGM